jgi:hypothetical protein
MGRLDIGLFRERVEFGSEHLPPARGFKWRFAREEEVDNEEPSTSGFMVSAGHFTDAGLSLPLDPLILEFMHRTGIPFLRIGLNIIRIITATSAINKRFDVRVGLREIFFCEKVVVPDSEISHFIPYPKAPEMIKFLPGSQKNIARRMIVVEAGPIIPEDYSDFEFPRPGQGRALIRALLLCSFMYASDLC